MKYNFWILIVTQFVLIIEWINLTIVMAMLYKIGELNLAIDMLNSYYLIMIGIILCSGFLYLGSKSKRADEK